MSKTVANWLAGSGSKSFRDGASSLVDFGNVRPTTAQQALEKSLFLNKGSNSSEIDDAVDVNVPAAAQKLPDSAVDPVAVAAQGGIIDIPAESPKEEQEQDLQDEEGNSEDHEDEAANHEFVLRPELGPQMLLKEQLEKDNEDESLRRWKEQLLGSSASLDAVGDGFFLEPEVKVLRLGIQAKGREELQLPFPLTTNAQGHTFSLKEGSHYHLKFVFTVRSNIVSGLTCINTVWKLGIMVDQTRSMLGTFGPQQEPYVHIMPEDVTPSGTLARGTYTANLRFLDDDGIVYLDVNYSFEICKDW